MTPERWTQIDQLYHSALKHEPDERATFLKEACAGDESLLGEVESLLALEQPAESFMEALAMDARAQGIDEDRARSMVGRQIGPYKILSLLGAGGMGQVYRARDYKLKRDVAVKVLPELFAKDANLMARFQREAQVLASLNHPNIAAIYGLEESDDVRALVMELVEGSTLADQAPIPLDEALPIARQMAEALEYAHEKGIIHRDLKPVNVKLTPEGVVKVLDFGLAKGLEGGTTTGDLENSPTLTVAATASGVILGTAAYMAPEQARGRAVDRRADIWSFGVVFYEILTGKRLFGGETVSDTLAAVLKMEPDWNALAPEVPPMIRRLLRRCLERDLKKRLQAIGEARITIEECLSTPAGRAEAEVIGLKPAGGRKWWVVGSIGVILLAITLAGWLLHRSDFFWQNPLAGARFGRFTDFEGSELDAAISSDGKFVAFLSDRNGPFDILMSQVGSGEFMNLTRGRLQTLNELTRSVGFSGDGANVCLTVARRDPSGKSVNDTIWLVPTMGGGTPHQFLENAVTAVWSPDGSQIVYHEPTPGDPIFVAERNGSNPKQVFIEKPGLHCHYPVWSPDGRLVYFVRGFPPNDMDIWRIPSAGGEPERITHHNSRVAYPALLDDHTLIYIAPAQDGSGSWLYTTDVERRIPHRVSFGVEQYLSVSASGDGRRLAATVANPSSHLWTVPISERVAEESAANLLSLPTARATIPRFGPDYLLYLSSKGGADGLWRFKDGIASELWKASEGSVPAAPAISPDGRQICFSVLKQGRGRLYLMTEDGTHVRSLAESLDVRGTMSWSPDGKWIVVAAEVGEGGRLFKIPVDGGEPLRITDQPSSNPVWSPDGRFIAYFEPVGGPLWPVKGVTPDKQPFALPDLFVLGGGDRYRFLPNGKGIVVLQGEFRRHDFWLLDLGSGRQRQLTNLRPGYSVKSFDISPDGKQILFDRVRENSDIVLIDLPRG